jgi:hypothetical protein
MAIPVETEEEIFNACMVSCNYDEEVASVVSKAFF